MSVYDRDHQTHRADWDHLIQAGHRPVCRRCGDPIEPGQRWQLGHITDLALGGNPKTRKPEHARCNETAGATLGNALRTAPPPSRPW